MDKSNLSWSQKLKGKWVKEMLEHQKADRLIQNIRYTEEDNGFRGCFFGCAMRTHEHALEKAADAMELPLWLIEAAEQIFEKLPKKEAVLFPVQLLEAIPVDTDLSDFEGPCVQMYYKLDRYFASGEGFIPEKIAPKVRDKLLSELSKRNK